jgi:hypothetical protein
MMEKTLHNRIGYLFIAILLICILGFYPTYISKFPEFKEFTSAHHFHGLMALLWILMLIVQPFLIRAKKYSLHRQIGKFSYILMPLLIISLFFVSKAGYVRNIKTVPEVDALAGLTNGIPDMLNFAILYTLAMVYRKNTAYHLRFMASTGIMMIGPGLGRFLIVTFGIPFPIVILSIILLTSGVGLAWMIMDIRNKKSAFPMGVFVGIGVFTTLININSHSAWWQSFAKCVVEHLF